MGILTKVFVLLVTILAVVLVSLIIPFVHNAFYYREQWKEMDVQRAVAVVDAIKARAGEQEARNDLRDQASNYNEHLDTLRTTNRDLQNEVSKLNQNLVKMETEKNQIQSSQQALTAANDKLARINEILTAESKAHRQRALDLEFRNINLNTRIGELNTEQVRLTRSVRSFQTQTEDQKAQIAQLQDELEKEKSKKFEDNALEIKGLSTNGFDPLGVTIRGSVMKVEKVGEDTLVQISVGSNDKVQENMEFIVHEGSKFVGTMIIIGVDQNVSIGRMLLKASEVKTDMRVMAGR